MRTLVLISFFFTISASAQDTLTDIQEPVITVEAPPAFPGGDSELFQYLSDNIEYRAHGELETKYYFQFTVTADGSISDVVVIKPEGAKGAFIAHVVQVLLDMPPWTPGNDLNGVAVDVKMTLPITIDWKE